MVSEKNVSIIPYQNKNDTLIILGHTYFFLVFLDQNQLI